MSLLDLSGKRVKFLGIFITYDVELLVEKNFKQRLKKIANLINLWRLRGLSIHGKVGVIKAILLPKMIYPSSNLTLWFCGMEKRKSPDAQRTRLMTLVVLK